MSLVFPLFLTISASPVSPSKIEASASLNKASYLIGEPIYLTLEFKNLSDKMIEFRTRLAFSYGDVKINILKPNQLPLDYKGIFEASIYPYYIFEVYPNQIERITLTILYSADSEDGLIFNKPGKAVISCSLNGLIAEDTVNFSFPAFPVEIKVPNEKDIQALKSLFAKSFFQDLHMNRVSSANIAKFETFLKEYPYSTYTPHVLFNLACSYMSKTGNREPDFQQAIKLFKLYISLYPDTILTDDAVYKIAEGYHGLKDFKTAKRWFIKLYNEYLNSNRVNHYDPLMKEYLFIEKDKNNPYLWMLFDPFVE
jgi:tetratricopeptide (TPR) repeat protein